MKVLNIDIETYSSNDLLTGGVHKYVEAEDFEILLFSYSVDGGPVQVVDLVNFETLPREINHALTDPTIIKTAFNAAFERTCISKFFLKSQDPAQWECTMIKSAMLGLPMSLAMVAMVLNLGAKKDTAGKALIKYFCVPCAPTKANGGRTRNMPEHSPEKWEAFKEYCKQDVAVEMAIREKISFYDIPDGEKRLWNLDQRINDTGICIDKQLVDNAIKLEQITTDQMRHEAQELTGLDNPNSVAQLKEWINDQTGYQVDSLNKEAIPGIIEATDSEDVKRLMTLRGMMAKTSIKKYVSMLEGLCNDGRIKGLFQFCGANRTWRWAGRRVQMQNLVRNSMKDLDLARELVKEGDLELLTMLYGNVPNVLSQLIRTAFIPYPKHRFIVMDFSAIEARVLAWLAGEKWRIDVFNSHGMIYEASAAAMFRLTMEEITKDIRQKGKVSELALGYGGGVGALISMGALKMGLTEDELPDLVTKWRIASPRIVQYWKDVNNASIKAVETHVAQKLPYGIHFVVEKDILFVGLPSGRKLAYMQPRIMPGKFGNGALTYWGTNQTTRQWERTETYGAKLVENIVQAIARDCLAHAMIELHAAKYDIVCHVHDEVVLDTPDSFGNINEVQNIMSTPAPWAKGLPLGAAGFECNYYKKD